MHFIVSTSHPGERGGLFPFLSTVLISLPANVLTSTEPQAYGEILIPFNRTRLGLNYLVKVLPVHKNHHFFFPCSSFLLFPSHSTRMGGLLSLFPALFCHIKISNLLCV